MTILYTAIDSPVGRIYLASYNDQLCSITLGRNAKEYLFQYVKSTFPGCDITSSKTALHKCETQLSEYFAGERSDFDIPLLLEGTDFQQSVWQELLKIPYGQTLSYGDLAVKLGKQGGMRAVGSANGKNPIPIIVPCHRVIAADGSLGGYSGGLDIKHKLLDLESQKFSPSLF